MSYRKIGGIHWLSIGRLRISWCLKRKPSESEIYQEALHLGLEDMIKMPMAKWEDVI